MNKTARTDRAMSESTAIAVEGSSDGGYRRLRVVQEPLAGMPGGEIVAASRLPIPTMVSRREKL